MLEKKVRKKERINVIKRKKKRITARKKEKRKEQYENERKYA